MGSGSNPFSLETVISRVQLEQGSRIEVLELKVGILYIGTSDGLLLQYGLVERRDHKGNQLLEANFIQSQQIGDQSRISFIHASPVINTVLVVCNGSLHILNMSDLSTRGSNSKIKGISAFAINESNLDQFSVQFCAAKKKQITMYSLDEEKLRVVRSKEVTEAVVSLAVDGETVCAALPSRYVLLSLETGHVIDLFPIEQSSAAPNITRIAEQEFLLPGPGNLGMFVTSEGTSVRPPVQWTAGLHRIVYYHPYIIGLSPECAMVYSISDQKLKQGLPYPGGRTLGCFDGTILVAGSSQVSSLLPVPWQVQAESLLDRESVDDLLHLIVSVTATPNLSQQSMDKLANLQQRAGFIYLAKGQLSQASEQLMAGRTDVREILSLYPGMLSPSSRFVRCSPALHNIPDISSVQPRDQEPSTEQFLLNYLLNLVEVEEYSPDNPEEVFTAVAKLLAETSPDGFAAFLSKENIVLHYEELVEFLHTRGLLHFQALLHEKFHNFDSACELWSSLTTKQAVDPMFPGPVYFASKLCGLDQQLAWACVESILAVDEEVGASVFIKHRNSDDQKFIEKSLSLMCKYKEARRIYLEDLVFNKQSQVEKHHTLLALMLIDTHSDLVGGNKLRKLILTSSHLNTRFLLDKLRETNLGYERAILHGRVKEYAQAIDILVNTMKDHALALRFCDDIADTTNKQEKEKLLFLLLSTYLHPAKEESREAFLVQAVDLINSRASDLNGTQVMSALPEDWNLATILPAVKVFLRETSHNLRMTKLTKNLSKGENLNTRQEYVLLSSQPVHIRPNNYCVVCKKSFVGSPVSRYPNGVLLHQDCVVNKEICPLTGQVFKLQI